MTLDNLGPNAILFTKDGRKCGNMLVVDVEYDHYFQVRGTELGPYILLTAVSDYGNLATWRLTADQLKRQFYVESKLAYPSHKHYDYKLKYPEEFL